HHTRQARLPSASAPVPPITRLLWTRPLSASFLASWASLSRGGCSRPVRGAPDGSVVRLASFNGKSSSRSTRRGQGAQLPTDQTRERDLGPALILESA